MDCVEEPLSEAQQAAYAKDSRAFDQQVPTQPISLA